MHLDPSPPRGPVASGLPSGLPCVLREASQLEFCRRRTPPIAAERPRNPRFGGSLDYCRRGGAVKSKRAVRIRPVQHYGGACGTPAGRHDPSTPERRGLRHGSASGQADYVSCPRGSVMHLELSNHDRSQGVRRTARALHGVHHCRRRGCCLLSVSCSQEGLSQEAQRRLCHSS